MPYPYILSLKPTAVHAGAYVAGGAGAAVAGNQHKP